MIDLPPPNGLWLPPKPAIIRQAEPRLINPTDYDREHVKKGTFPMPMFCPGGKSVLPKPVLTNPDFYSSTANAGSYNTGVKSIGAAGSNRMIAIAVATYSGSGIINTATIDGSNMTSIIGRQQNSRSRQLYARIFALPWNNANTTATFVLGCTGTVTSIAMRIFNIVGLQSNTAFHTASSGGGDNIMSTTTNTNFAQDGCGVAVTSLWDSGVSSGTGLANYTSMNVEWPKAMMWGDSMAAETGRPLVFNHGSGGTSATTVAASWR